MPDPAIHKQYRQILGFTGFMVQMTRADLASAYAELSKCLSCPCPKHLAEAEHMMFSCWEHWTWASHTVIQALTLTTSLLCGQTLILQQTLTTAALSLGMSAAQVAWKAKCQACVTLSTAEAEFVAASIL